jgi:hypothetical protein
MHMMKKVLAMMLLIFFATGLTAQDQLTIKGEFRPKTEMRSGYGSLNAENKKPAYLVSQRTRLQLFYEKDWLKTGFSAQDIRFWGEDDIYNATGMFGNNANVDVNEAWVEMSFLGHSSLRAGRQYFNYDDGRLLSWRNWNDRAISYDALLYQYKNEGLDIDFAVSYNADKNNRFFNPYPSAKMRTMNFLRVQQQFSDNFTASIIALGSGFTKNNDSETIYMKGSYGARLHYKQDGLSTWTTFYFQNGKSPDGRDASAWNFNWKGDYSFGGFKIGLGATLISGEQTDNEKDNQFDLLYGVRHAVYGFMDYFNNLPAATNNGGLNNLFFTSSYKISPKTTLFLDYHYFALNQTVIIEGDELDAFLGTELDLGVAFRFSPEVNLRGGYSFIIPNSSLEILQGIGKDNSEFSSWAFLMLTVKPTFFKSL